MAWEQIGSLQTQSGSEASNSIGKGKGGHLVKGRDSDGKVLTYTPVDEVSDSRELVSKGWVDHRVQQAVGAQPIIQVVSKLPEEPDPNTLYLVG